MTIDRTELYWSSLCKLISKLICWVHIVRRQDFQDEDDRWGQLLTISIEGYLEGPAG